MAFFSFVVFLLPLATAGTAGPSLRTENGTITMKVAGASLTLSSELSSSCTSDSSSIALLGDVSAAATGLQAQMTAVQATITAYTANLTAAFLLAQQSQIDVAKSSASAASNKVDLLSAATASLSVGVGARVDGLSTAASTSSTQLSSLSSVLASLETTVAAKADTAALSTTAASLTSSLGGRIDTVSARADSLSSSLAAVASTAAGAATNSQSSSMSTSIKAISDSTAISFSQIQTNTSSSIANVMASLTSMATGQVSTSSAISSISTAVAQLQVTHATDVSSLRAGLAQEITNRTAAGLSAANRLDVLEQQAAATSTRMATLETRLNNVSNITSLMQVCMASGRSMDAQGRCVSNSLDFCLCPAGLPRVRGTCVAGNGQTAVLVCDAGYTLVGSSPVCSLGTWVGAFPNCTGVPFFTSSASLFLYDIERATKTFQITASEPDGTVVSFSLASGTLPSGFSLLSSGLITGTAAAVVVATSSTFVVRASTLGGASINATLSITRYPPVKLPFSYTGSDQSFSVPTGLTRFGVKLWGAGGACQEPDAGYGGGSGGYLSAVFTVGSGITAYALMVGQGGLSGATLGNGGGGAGGGLAGIFSGSGSILDTDRARAIAIAGGGGGESDNNNEFGGAGGGTSGLASANGASSGGSQTGPGGPLSPSATTMRGRDCEPPSSPAGSSLVTQYGFGGRSWQGNSEVPNGGGGAGYYGGGSSNGGTYNSGGGGSGYLNPAFLVGTGTLLNGAGGGVPNSAALNDPDYPGSSVSYGGRQNVAVGQNGFPGYAVINY